jgi:dihydrolipoamide dehydrogenase
MPSKLLIAAAEAAELGRHSAQFGVHFSGRSVDGKAVMQRVGSERDRFVGFVVETVEGWPEAHRLKGFARFKSDHILEVGDMEIEAERIVIATGSRPNIAPAFQALGERLIINDDIFDWQDLPESVAVFGAGVIGLELGQALSRLGVRVSLFGRNGRVGPLSDPAVIAHAQQLFKAEFDFQAHADVRQMRLDGDRVFVEYQQDEDVKKVHFDYVLAATGRVPNLERLGLENTTLPLDERGVPEYDLYNGRVGESHVFIAGDVNQRFPLLHEASDEGMVAGYNAAHYPDVRMFKKSSPITVVFSDPQIMMVGSTHRELEASDLGYEVGEVDWAGQGRSRVMLVNRGLLRVYGELHTGRFLGAEMVGPRAEHLAHLLAWAHQSNLTVTEMLERPYYHPVIEEGLRTALRDLNYRLQMGPKSPARCLDCGPGA